VPVVVGASEGEREFFGARQIAALVRSLREECDSPIFLNADHTHSLAKAVEAAKAGFDAIVFDLSALPFEQNVRQTKEAVETLKTINSAIAQRSSPGLAVGVDRHRALQRVGATGEMKKTAQRRNGFRQSGCDRSTILTRARFQPCKPS